MYRPKSLDFSLCRHALYIVCLMVFILLLLMERLWDGILSQFVSLDDIEIIFYEEKSEASLQTSVQPWSAKGRFGPNDVHHQYAIVFQTPPFYNLAVERPVQVQIALRRPSDSELSESKPFLYLPQEFGKLIFFVS